MAGSFDAKSYYKIARFDLCQRSKSATEQELLNMVVSKGTENLSTKENKCKEGPRSKVCYCAPTTHEGSFRCRLHRKKLITEENKNNLGFNSKYGIVEFQPQMSRFAGVQVETRHSLIKLSSMDSI